MPVGWFWAHILDDPIEGGREVLGVYIDLHDFTYTEDIKVYNYSSTLRDVSWVRKTPQCLSLDWERPCKLVGSRKDIPFEALPCCNELITRQPSRHYGYSIPGATRAITSTTTKVMAMAGWSGIPLVVTDFHRFVLEFLLILLLGRGRTAL